MRLVFMGTPGFSVPTLKALVSGGHNVLLAVSQPDRPGGRGLALRPTPVKAAAVALGVPVAQPETLKDPDFGRNLEEIELDAIIVAAYGKILPKWLLGLPKEGCLNVHASILPAYRGAAPIQRALMDGVEETGVTIMRMDEGMDTGDILLVREISVGPGETAGELSARLSEIGAEAMVEALDRLAKGMLDRTHQDHTRATYAPKVGKEEAGIDWSASCRRIKNLVRALNPVPGAFTSVHGRRVKVFQVAEVRKDALGGFEALENGTVVDFKSDAGPVVLCKDGAVALTEVQPAGKRAMSGVEFMRGRYVAVRDRFGHD
ncbi:MAG: methionyl-tRNA formyltransferase [Actinobacteria bacterium]|nr:methionyl-tRNA formyltransferase [Actinomycetota bacterium]